MSSRAPIGYIAVAEVPTAINQGFIAMIPNDGISNLFLLVWADEAQEEVIPKANGLTFFEISKKNFRPIELIVPTLSIMIEFDRLVRPLYQRFVTNEKESRTLAVLLPKLMSGEVRVQNIPA